MDFQFTEDQGHLRETLRKWTGKSYPFERRVAIAKEGGLSSAAYAELAALGLCGLKVPGRYGGLELGSVECMVAMEELGRGLVLEPIAQAITASTLITTYAGADLQARWLPEIALGKALVVLGHVEWEARYRLDLCSTQALQDGGRWFVSGAKCLVPAGDHADAFVVPALLREKLALFMVKRRSPGVSARAYSTQDGGRAADLTFDRAAAELLTAKGGEALQLGVDTAIALLCAEAIGVMERALTLTADYLKIRKQFGVEIGHFQALRHRVADMKMQLELARSMSYYATLKLDAPEEERRRAVSSAKYQLGSSMRFVGQQAVQLHGAIGLTDEHVVSHLFRRLTQMEMSFGDSMHHLAEVSARMRTTAGVI